MSATEELAARTGLVEGRRSSTSLGAKSSTSLKKLEAVIHVVASGKGLYSDMENHYLSWSINYEWTTSGWWFGTSFIFPYIGNVIIPIDFHIFQRGRSTTNQIYL